jgi:hypothetical protein
MKRYIPAFFLPLIATPLLAGGIMQKPVERIVAEEIPSQQATPAATFGIDRIGLSVGLSKLYDKKTNIIFPYTEPKERFDAYELFTTFNGICDDENTKPYLSYTYTTNSDFKEQHLLVGINRYFQTPHDAELYAGVVVGYGELKWKYNPIGSQDNDFTATSWMGGVQAGLEYAITDSFALHLNTKALMHNYEAILDPNTQDNSFGTLEHQYSVSGFVGVVVKF